MEQICSIVLLLLTGGSKTASLNVARMVYSHFFLNKFVMFKDLKKYIGPTSKLAAEVGLKVARSTTKAVSNFAKSNPEEAKSTIIGTSARAGIGFAIGGSIGVVGFFGGIGIPWIVLMALSGGALGNPTRHWQGQS